MYKDRLAVRCSVAVGVALVALLATWPVTAATIAHRYNFANDTAEDSAGTVNGAVQGTPAFADDSPSGNRSMAFSGDDYVLFSDAMDFGRQFSIALWVKPDPAALGIQNLIGNGPGGWDTNGFKWYYNTWSDPATADGALILETGDGADVGNAGDAVRTDVGVMSTNTWKHLVSTVDVDTGSVAFYVDGAAATTSGGLNRTMATGSPWELGRMMGSWNLHGSLDDVQIYSGILTADEVGGLFNNPGTVVPEPSTWLLLLVGALAVMRLRRRR